MDYMSEVKEARKAIQTAMELLQTLIATLPEAPQQQRVEKAIAELAAASAGLEFRPPNASCRLDFVAAEASAVAGQSGAPDSASEVRRIAASVHQIDVRGPVNVSLRRGEAPRLTVHSTRPNDLARILTTIAGGCLTVDMEPTMVVTSERSGSKQVFMGPVGMVAGGDIIKGGREEVRILEGRARGEQADLPGFRVEVTLPRVTDLRVSGAGTLLCADLDQEELSLDLSGAGSITATGKVARLYADVSGAGSIGGYGLVAARANLLVSGSGAIKATVTESLRARVSGVGKIKVAGHPCERDTNVSGLGKIKFVEREG